MTERVESLIEVPLVLETGDAGKLRHLEFKEATGTLPVLEIGDLMTAEKIFIGFPGIGIPSQLIEDKLYNFYLKAVPELKRLGWAIVLPLNWRGYGEGRLETNLAIPEVEKYSLAEKKAVILFVSQRVGSQAKKDSKIVVAGHSTAGRALLEIADRLLENPRVFVDSLCPSAIGADSFLTKTLGALAKAHPKTGAAIFRFEGKMPIWMKWLFMSQSYGTSSKIISLDPLLSGMLHKTKPEVIAQEMAAESGGSQLPFEPNNRIAIVGCTKDKLVRPKKFPEWIKQMVYIFPGMSHLFLREPNGPELLVKHLEEITK